MQALEDKKHSVRESAAYALGNLTDSRVIEPLIEAMRDTEKSVREAAAISLSKLHDPRIVEPLLIALGDENKEIHYSAVRFFTGFKELRAVEPLSKLLDHQAIAIRALARRALDKQGVSETGKMENMYLAEQIPFRLHQCTRCVSFHGGDQQNNWRCEAYKVNDPFGDLLAIFTGETNEDCAKFIAL